jgi:hypothetical protein
MDVGKLESHTSCGLDSSGLGLRPGSCQHGMKLRIPYDARNILNGSRRFGSMELFKLPFTKSIFCFFSLFLSFRSFISLACANSETISETVENLHVWKIL